MLGPGADPREDVEDKGKGVRAPQQRAYQITAFEYFSFGFCRLESCLAVVKLVQNLTADSAEPSANGTGAENLYIRLREAILYGRLAPSLVISQVQLARELGMSRTPLREALRMLQREGLVTGEANRMIRIAPLSIADVEELYAVRIGNETLGIRLTVPIMTAEDDSVLEESLRLLAGYSERGDIDAWERQHRVFHTRLVYGAGPRLNAFLSELYDHAERYRRLYITSEPRAMSIGAAEHEAIVEACHARDGRLAAAELGRHLSRTALTALLQIAPEHEPAMVRAALRAVLGTETPPSGLRGSQG